MSEARRKKQQERDGDNPISGTTKKYLTWGGIVVLFVAVYLSLIHI